MKHTYNYLLILFTFLGVMGVNPIVEAQSTSSPKTVLLLGVDTGDLGRVEQGRSDTLMVINFDETDNSAILASIPRDAYVDIPGYGMDKINHAYAFGGADLSMQAVNGLLGTEIQSYVAVNMAGLKEIIDVVGTITVVPPTSFTIGEYSFTAGVPTELDSDMALAYARERYTSGGDYARQERQREIVQAIVSEAASVESIVNYIPMFSALSENISTNLTLNELIALFSRYKNLDSIETYQLSGYGEMIDGIYYDQIDSGSLAELQTLIGIQ
ncbi:LCP family protein [Aerococcaceae bacterium WGS1372]